MDRPLLCLDKTQAPAPVTSRRCARCCRTRSRCRWGAATPCTSHSSVRYWEALQKAASVRWRCLHLLARAAAGMQLRPVQTLLCEASVHVSAPAEPLLQRMWHKEGGNRPFMSCTPATSAPNEAVPELLGVFGRAVSPDGSTIGPVDVGGIAKSPPGNGSICVGSVGTVVAFWRSALAGTPTQTSTSRKDSTSCIFTL